ncbi:MAG: IS30 family transposase, partial [Lentisphaeria bacterium]
MLHATFSPKEIANELYTVDRNRMIPDPVIFESRIYTKKVAQELGRHPSTISRELKRNTGLRGYRP